MQQHRHRDVVRQVRDKRGRLAGNLRRQHTHRVGFDDGQAIGQFRRSLGHRLRQASREVGIDLDRDDPIDHVHQRHRQRTETRPYLENDVVTCHACRGDDAPHGIGVVNEVLPQLFRGPDTEFLGKSAHLDRTEQGCLPARSSDGFVRLFGV